MNIRDVMTAAAVIPVIVIDNPKHAVPLANALLAGGLRSLEITLRTPAAMESILAIKHEVPGATIGAGTVNNLTQMQQCIDAELDFVVSPGFQIDLANAASDAGMPYLPGVASASEVLTAQMAGFDCVKFFPAQAAGGTVMLKALASPFANVQFCPTGGISAENYQQFLALPNVSCVGGSWVAPAALVTAQDWPQITALAQQAANRQ